MTDKEIIKGLKCCLGGKEELCKECPFNGECYGDVDYLIAYALGLINRQQEQLDAAISGQETLQKALAEKDEEIKRLKNNVFCSVVIDEGKMRNIVNEKVAEFELDIESIKSEAIKEFAERLKKHYDEYDDYDDIYARHMRDDIDFLLDDMVGDTNA